MDLKVGMQGQGHVAGIISATGINDLLAGLDAIEKKDRVIGFVVSGSIAIVLFLALMFWYARAGLVMGIDEPEWKTIGLISPGADYGINELGQKDINNFQAPSPNADGSNRPPSQNAASSSAATAASATPSSTPEVKGVITQADENVGVTATSGKETANPTSNPNATGSSNSPVTDPKATGTVGGGSNDGETNQVGDTGNPNSKVLNENGLFTFGNGIGGAGGRRPVKTELKGYNVQLEEKIKFEITIDPNGDVIFVKAPFAVHQELVAIGKENIKKWKFSETDPSAGNLRTTVSISFVLK